MKVGDEVLLDYSNGPPMTVVGGRGRYFLCEFYVGDEKMRRIYHEDRLSRCPPGLYVDGVQVGYVEDFSKEVIQ